MKRSALALIAIMSALAARDFVAAQQPPRDPGAPRDAAPVVRTGTAAIVGTVVVDDAAARPIRMALVTIKSTDEIRQYQTATDAEGRFVATGLPAGRFTLNVAKAGFVTTSFGARSPTAPGVPIVVTDGQRVTVPVKLARAAAIMGTVRSCGGYANAGQVSAMRIQTINGERRFVPTGISTGVDDRGMYRIWGLPAGEYVVQTGALTIVGIDTRLITPADLQWAQQQLQSPTAGPASAGAPPPQSPAVTFVPCYYPGTIDESLAQVVKVAAGEEQSGVDVTGQLARAATIQGTMTDPNGQPPTSIQAMLVRPNSMLTTAPQIIVRTAADGKFSLSRVPPGDYVLVARGATAGVPITRPAGPVTPASIAAALPLWTTLNLSINGEDMNDVQVRLQPGMTVSGRIVFEQRGGSAPPDGSQGQITLIPAGGNMSAALAAMPTQAKPDGTFSITGVPQNSFRLTAGVVGSNANTWVLKSATMAGRDSTDVPVEVRAGEDVADAVITFTDTPAQVTGRLVDSAGQPIQGYVLLAFSTDRRFWLTSSRRVALARSANDGSYRFNALPPGDYHLCAAVDVDEAQIDDALLDALSGASLRLTLGEGERKQQDFRLGS